MRDCQCQGAGWCARHQVQKTSHWVNLCQTNDSYFDAWERGEGPGQYKKVRTDQVTKTENKTGWGDRVEQQLKKMGITQERYKAVKEKFGLPPNCNCDGRREWLNKVGRWWNGEEEPDDVTA